MEDIQKLKDFLVDNKPKYFNESEVEVLPKPSADVQSNYSDFFNSMNVLLLLLVIYFMGPRFKILRVSWYNVMKPFQCNLALVMEKYLCSLHVSFPGID